MARAIKSVPQPAKDGAKRQRKEIFLLDAPGAFNVQLAGDFTNWQESPIHLQRTIDGTWQAAVPLRPGVYQYRYIVDGQWRDDAKSAAQEPNPFGSCNAVRHVI
jgi:1,4-alpha-glucan branching enzyme